MKSVMEMLSSGGADGQELQKGYSLTLLQLCGVCGAVMGNKAAWDPLSAASKITGSNVLLLPCCAVGA